MPYTITTVNSRPSPTDFRTLVDSSGIATAYDAVLGGWLDNTPTIPSVLNRNDKPVPFASVLSSLEMKYYVSTAQITHFEKESNESTLNVIAVLAPAGGAGNAMTVSVETFTFAGGTQSVPRVRETYRTPTDVTFYVQSVNRTTNPHQMTIIPTISTVDLDSHVFNGDVFGIRSNAGPEGQLDLIEGMTPRYDKYTNTFQIITESFSTTGTSATYALEPLIEGNHGPQFLDDRGDMIYRNELAKSNAILFGEQFNNVTSTNSRIGGNVAVNGTEGIYTFADTYGHDSNYTIGNYTITDFENLDRIYHGENYMGGDLWCLDGHELFRSRTKVLKEYVTETNVDLTARIGDKLGVKNGFEAFSKDGRNYILWKLSEFNDARNGGLSNYEFVNRSLVVPMGFRPDAKTNLDRPMVGYACRVAPDTNYIRENLLVEIDGTKRFLPVTNIEGDWAKIGYRSEVGAHAALANLMVVEKGI